jgi:ABC-type branched-subunit amino acid transport system substrate-binding protein
MMQGFKTLNDLTHYTRQYPEYPESDSLLYTNPLYTKFHASIRPSWWNRLLNFFHITRPAWTIHTFYDLLTRYLQQPIKKNEVITLEVPSGTTFIIFGSLHGALHSLERDFHELQKQGIIDNHFNIIAPNHYIVFNGNAIDLSAYSLEVLTVILRLQLTNPDKVFYIQGLHEAKEYWHDYSLAYELKSRAFGISNELIPLNKEVKQLFDHLPKALVIREKSNPQFYYLISYFKFDEHTGLHIPEEEHLQAQIMGDHTSTHIAQGNGLYLLSPTGKTPAQWAIVSSPIRTYRMHYNFHYDSFGMIHIHQEPHKSTMTSYYHDVRKKESAFEKNTVFSLNSGTILSTNAQEKNRQELIASLCPTKKEQNDEAVIFVGSSLDLSKALSTQGKALKLGMTLCIDYENRRGGVRGKIIKPIFMDDQYEPSKARANIEQFMKEYKSSLLLCPLGSPTLKGYLDLLESGQVFIFFPETGSPTFRDARLQNILHWRPSIEQEGKQLTHYIIKTYQPKTVAYFYQDDLFGQSALKGALEEIKDKDITVIKLPYNTQSLALDSIVREIIKHQPDALGFLSTSVPSAELIRRLPHNLLLHMKIFGVSDLSEEYFKAIIKDRGLKMTTGHMVPPLSSTTWPLIDEYKKVIAPLSIKPDPFILEGYISASLMIEILRKIDGDITHEKILEVANAMKNYDYKGMILNFNPQTRELAHYFWIETGAGEWITVKTEK